MTSLPTRSKVLPGLFALGVAGFMSFLPGRMAAQDAVAQGSVISTEGQVEYSPKRAAWSAAVANQKLTPQDRLRTLALSRAMVQLVDLGRVRVDERTTLEILPPRNPKSKLRKPSPPRAGPSFWWPLNPAGARCSRCSMAKLRLPIPSAA